MRKIYFPLLLAWLLTAFCLMPPAAAAEAPRITATSAIVIEMPSGRVLYEKNTDAQAYQDSMTKMMTCLVALETKPLDYVCTVTPDVRYVEYSEMELLEGDEIRLGELLKGMMLISDNGAAYAVAKNVGGSAIRFAALMNKKAKEIGLTGTHFVNPNGLPQPNHYSTARDMAHLAAYGWRNSDFRRLVSMKDGVAKWEKPAGKSFELENTNALLWDYPGANGIKTGYTMAAGGCLAAAAERGGKQLIAVVMHSDDADIRFADAAKILDYGFEQLAAKNNSPYNSARRQRK